MSLKTPINGTKLQCPVCGKEFKATDETRYIIHDAWTCSWKCFKAEHIKLNEAIWAKQKETQSKLSSGVYKKRGRKKKDDAVKSTYNDLRKEIQKKSEE